MSRLRRVLPLAFLLALVAAVAIPHLARADDDGDDDDTPATPSPTPETKATINAPGAASTAQYTAPTLDGAIFLETFQSPGGFDNPWVHVQDPKYSGRFIVGTGKAPAIPGDKGLIIPEKARFYGIVAPMEIRGGQGKEPLVLQYEVKYEEQQTCGGAYLKFVAEPFDDWKNWKDSVPYSIMFGPDKCGTTDKVHFIMQTKNPVSGKFVEHHWKSKVGVTAGSGTGVTHLYTLVVRPDGSFEVHVDGELKEKGTIQEDMEPPIQPPEQIDDPEDKKPADWVDEKQIPDPDAKKPEDWDEDEPKTVPDESAEKPEGWLDDEPEMIPDPEAEKPDEWNDEEDGTWEAPTVPNPKCEDVGCGEWKRPMIPNPKYKGKWSAPLIANPKYIGEWKPRKIPNPDYYIVEEYSLLPISGVGIEIWTMDHGFMFDNILVTNDLEKAQQFARDTFSIKHQTEMKAKPAEEAEGKTESKPKAAVADVLTKIETALFPLEGILEKAGLHPLVDKLVDMGVSKPLTVIAAGGFAALLLALVALSLASGKNPAPRAPAKKDDRPTPDDASSTTTSGSQPAAQRMAAAADEAKPDVKKRTKRAE